MEKAEKKAYKLIFIDMDGTLYDMEDMVIDGYNSALDYLVDYQGFSSEEAELLLKENHIYPYVSEDACSATAFFMSRGYDVKEWDQKRSENFNCQPIDINKAMKLQSLRRLSESAALVLLTNNTLKNVKRILHHLHIPEDVFTEIFCNEKENKTPSKKPLMEQLMTKYQARPEETLSIGDRYNVDGRPLVELGGDALIIRRPQFIEEYLNDKEKDIHYVFYEGKNR